MYCYKYFFEHLFYKQHQYYYLLNHRVLHLEYNFKKNNNHDRVKLIEPPQGYFLVLLPVV